MWRIALIAWFALIPLASAFAQGGSKGEGSSPSRFRVYVGTYTGPKSQGIYQLELDPATGVLQPRGLAAETPSPSFLAIHPSRKFLYAANEVGQYRGKESGSVSAFAIDPRSGRLELLNAQPSGGAHPCFVAVDPTGRDLLVANYSGGSVEVLPIGPDGRLGEPSAVRAASPARRVWTRGRQSRARTPTRSTSTPRATGSRSPPTSGSTG